MTHSPDCSGCPKCSALAHAILLNPTNPVLRDAMSMGRGPLRALADATLRNVLPSRNDDVPAAPDSYERGVAALQLANATDLSTFEETYKAERLAALAAEHDRVDAHLAAHPTRRLSAAELSTYAPPDGYALALQKEKRR